MKQVYEEPQCPSSMRPTAVNTVDAWTVGDSRGWGVEVKMPRGLTKLSHKWLFSPDHDPQFFSTYLLQLLLHPDVHSHLIAAFAHLSLLNEFACEACLLAVVRRLKQQDRVSDVWAPWFITSLGYTSKQLSGYKEPFAATRTSHFTYFL